MRMAWIGLVVGCSAGGAPKEEDTQGCEVIIDTTAPANGAIDADPEADVEFHLSDADPDATIETDIPGALERADDDRTLRWILSAPLDRGAEYAATLHYCRGEAELMFRTREGEPPV